MSKRHVFSLLMWLAAGTAIVYAPACDDHSTVESTDDTVYEGGTNDEALVKLDEAKATDDPAGGPVFVVPDANASLVAAPPPTFSWKASPTAARMPTRAPVRIAAPAPFGSVRSAHAHGAPVNGRAYLVAFTGASGAPVLRVFTTTTTYTPNAARWERLRASGASLTATITTASYDNNNIVPDGGPRKGAPRTFSIAR